MQSTVSSSGRTVPTDLHQVELGMADWLVVCSLVLELVGVMVQASLATWHSEVLFASALVELVAAAKA